MAKVTTINPFTILHSTLDVSYENIRNWNITQSESLSKTVQLIESDVTSILLYSPAIRASKKEYSTKLYKHAKSYLKKKRKPNKGERNEIKKLTQNLGLLVPVSDISGAKHQVLNNSMNILSQITADFQYVHLLDALAEEVSTNDEIKLPLNISALLFSIEKYINLVLFSDSLITSVVSLDGWLSYLSPIYPNQLNAQQFLSWFYGLVDKVTISNNPVILEDEDEFHPKVLELIAKYKKAFVSELKEVKQSNSKYFFFNSFPDLRSELFELLQLDKEMLTLDSFITYFREIKYTDKGRYAAALDKSSDEESLISQIGKSFTRKNIINKVKSIINSKSNIDDFSLFSLPRKEYEKEIKRKSRLTETEYRSLLEIAKLTFLPINKNYFVGVNRKYKEYELSLSNTLTRPFYFFDDSEDLLIPKLNIASIEEIDSAISYLEAKNAHERAESELLNSYLTTIRNVYSQVSLEHLVEKVPSFFYVANQRKWNIAIEQANESIKSRVSFRQQKMRELGIDLDENYTDAQKELFLTEMLKIEEEIQNFVPFVTASFKTALPTTRTTKFDNFRHQSDGIEFDPETVFDPEKWLRGNVMKTLKTSVKKGDVTQVNCFCLDLSGSMDHQRMRNLYKMLYLLVTGLQSRKSFDAFHFFSNDFIPGVEFDYEYTRKNLLFKILTIVSKIVGPRVLFTGLEGTNISQGILGCEERMVAFTDQLRLRNPNINLSCSMFVITDGLPSIGIRNLNELNKFVEKRREETGIAIKGIYIKSPKDKTKFITKIFGEDHAVETNSFEEGVQKFTSIMTKTYLQQRKNYKWEKKRRIIESQKR